ncbi:hypothetical protein CASFOL_003441 [Castilleja foliolosa]|uniref:Rubredoxin-like domain-containing protein n=1 Tax=Castilleja foliolosa TaxID=1961234 RepID=A0ABD3EH63_9LAMI
MSHQKSRLVCVCLYMNASTNEMHLILLLIICRSSSHHAKGAEVDVKRLPKRPAPPAFGRKLTDAQKERATHICLDRGYIYTLSKSFDEQPDEYVCPQCRAPKKRFSRYDVNTGKAVGGGLPPIGVIIGLIAGIGGVGALLVYGIQ